MTGGSVGPTWIDDHCHLPADGWEAVVDEAAATGVHRVIDVGTDVATSAAAIARAEASDAVWATAGVHPHEARHGLDGLETLLTADRCVAVGECGFDFHYNHSPPTAQTQAFSAQVDLAHRHGLALVIHTREAWEETFAVLDAEGTPKRTVFHCFTGGPDEAAECLARGAYLSFSGIVSFPSADDVRAAAARCPLDRVLVETDSPYLAPVPYRGKQNRPAYLPDVASALAQAVGTTLDTLAAATWANAAKVYELR